MVSRVWAAMRKSISLIDGLFVVEGDGGDGFGQSEDHVEVCGGQQLGLPPLDPLGARRPTSWWPFWRTVCWSR
jgi:hypothetical protein